VINGDRSVLCGVTDRVADGLFLRVRSGNWGMWLW
jgi:hypothetical protein